MRACVTGATGFIGGALVRALLARGDQVRALVRPGSQRTQAPIPGLEYVEVDLNRGDSLLEAVRGTETLFHLAALYSTREEDAQTMYQVNVVGTKNVLLAARAAGVRRVVHCSTIGTVGQPRHGLPTEHDEFTQWETSSHYARSKFLAEQLALSMCNEGLPVVVVNPCGPVGIGDTKPTSTGQRIVDYLEGRMPRFLAGGINFVPVDDVAAGHILAAEHGRLGHRYILGSHEGNLNLESFLTLMERVSGQPRPIEAARRGPFLTPRHAVGLGGPPPALVCDPSRAVDELGMPQSSLEAAFAEAVTWFRQRGHVRGSRPASLRLRLAMFGAP